MRLRGEKHPMAKLTDAQARRLKTLWEDGCTSPELSARYGVSRQQVWRIARGKSRLQAAEQEAGT